MHAARKNSKSPRLIKRYKKASSDLQKLERQTYWNYINQLIEPINDENTSAGGNQKRFWNYIKTLRRDTTGIQPLKSRHTGKLVASPEEKANILNEQYKSVFTEEDTSFIPAPTGKPLPSMEEIVVTEEGVRRLLHKMNPHKAAGPDTIPAKVLKECADELSPMLVILFNKTFSDGLVPDDWKKANVTAIFKKGNRSDAANYRPVSLTSLCCKIQEHIVTSSIMRHLEAHKALSDTQHGFRARRSCETQLLTLTHELAKNMDMKKQTDIVILDFSKAFDRVPHQRLLGKLDHLGVRGQTYKWIKAFLDGRTQQVVVEGAKSEEIDVVSGVPQGTVLGPLLFLTYINDLPDGLNPNTHVRLFADDCILYRVIDTAEDSRLLQEDLNRLAMWEKSGAWTFTQRSVM